MPTFYPLADRCPGIPLAEQRHLRAVRTGEYRPPLKGEWFLSGAIPQAYRCISAGLSYHILKIVRVEIKTTYRIKEVIDNGTNRR